MKKCIVLLSGGMDSCVTLAIAIRSGFQACLLHFNYGQLTEKRELKAFHELAQHYNIPPERQHVIDLPYFAKIGGSSLTDPNLKINKNGIQSGIPSSYVPFRNANFLSIAVSFAEVIRATHIFIGAVEEDSSGYPDCRQIFYQAFQKAISTGTKPETKIRIETPLINKSKAEIVALGRSLQAPFELTWSCYEREDTPCGKCDSCRLRRKGFQAE